MCSSDLVSIITMDGMEEDALEQGDMPDVLVDAMFGTGFHGIMRGNGLKAAEYINNCHEKHGKKADRDQRVGTISSQYPSGSSMK